MLRNPAKTAARATLSIALAVGLLALSTVPAEALWPFDAGAASPTVVETTPIRVYLLAGAVHEKPSAFNPFNTKGGVVMGELRAALTRDIGDADVKHLLFKVRGLGVSPAQAEELGALMTMASKAGKTTTVHIDHLDLTTLVAFGGATRLVLTPEGDVLLTGLHVEVAFYRELLANLGITADFEAVGEFKSAGESFTRDSMSDAARQNLDAWLDDVWLQLRTQISARAEISIEDLDRLIDGGMHEPEAIRRAGLVDTLAYWPETVALTETKYGGVSTAWPPAPVVPTITSVFDLLSLLADPPASETPARPTIAVLVAEGAIVEGSQPDGLFSGDSVIAVENILDDLHAITSDPNVKAIVLRIDSPGGSALASDIIWRALSDAAKDRPLIVSLGSVAASGGYYIASAGQRIFADAMTLTGSIGVFGGKLVYSDLTKKIGIHTTTLGRGKLHAAMSGLTRFNDDERAAYRAQLERTYRTFINRVARGRNMGFDAVEAVARGRIWTGAEALERGLVDQIGGLDAAIAEALTKTGLAAEDAEIKLWPRPKGLMDLLSGDDASGRIEIGGPDLLGAGGLLSALPPALAQQLGGAARLLQRLLGGSGVLAYLPLDLSIR